MSPDNEHNESNRFRGIKPKTEEKYRQAIELYRSTRLSCAEISRICKVTVLGFQRYLFLYHRDLLLARYNITCDKKEGSRIKLGPLRGQLPATHVKYKDAIEACESLDYIEYNVSQIAREFGLEGTNLGRQLRTIPKSSNGGRRCASGWAWVTTYREAHANTAKSSTPRLWKSCVRTAMSRYRKSPNPAVFPTPVWNSTCCFTTRIW